jgi:hypothetical protein
MTTNDHAELAQKIVVLETQLQTFAAQNRQLKEAVDKMTAQKPSPPPALAALPSEGHLPAFPTHRAKHNKPPEFDGRDKTAANTFLAHLHLHFLASPHLFPDDYSKILFAATYLRGPAFSWLEPHLLRENDPIVGSWPAFQKAFLEALGDPDRERTVTRSLQTLIQTGSAAAYSTEFFRLAAFLQWNDQALQAQFHVGLKPEVKDALALSDRVFTTVQDLSSFVIRLDNRLFERRKDSRRTTTPTHQTPLPSATPRIPHHNPPGPTPMVLDANRPRFRTLPQEERQRRFRLGLCMYCGEAGHTAFNCPNRRPYPGPRPTGPLQAASSSVTPDELGNALAQASEDATA